MSVMKILIAGPRAVSGLADQIKEKLHDICEKGFHVLVGDADGIDKAVQVYLSSLRYDNVIVYASNGKARNNIGNWPVEAVPVSADVRGFDFYAMKDKAMAADADYGFMIWNGKSRGTLSNIVNLLGTGKKSLVYFIPRHSYICIDSFAKLEKLLCHCGNGAKALSAFYQTAQQSNRNAHATELNKERKGDSKMPNWCSSKYAFYADDENKDELLRLHNNLSGIMKTPSEVENGFEPGWLGKVAIKHGIDWESLPCKGTIEHLDRYKPGGNFFTLNAETAWSPTEELWETVIARYEGISFVYIAEEAGNGIFTNTDAAGTFFPEKYLFEIWGNAPIPEGWFAGGGKPGSLCIREYFEDFGELADYCAKLTGKEFGTFEELQSYFFGIFEEENIFVGIHEFEAA